MNHPAPPVRLDILPTAPLIRPPTKLTLCLAFLSSPLSTLLCQTCTLLRLRELSEEPCSYLSSNPVHFSHPPYHRRYMHSASLPFDVLTPDLLHRLLVSR